MSQNTVKASELVAQLQKLIQEHGDLPVLCVMPDLGAFPLENPRFDSDGAGDNCFLV